MNLSLSNTLGKRMAINPDGLSLDLAFAADKTLTARKGPTPTFTRASTATFVGDDGLIQSAAIDEARFDHDPVTLACKGLLIEEARTNAATYSQDMTVANGWPEDQGTGSVAWTNNATTSPDGTINAEKLQEGSLLTSARRITPKAVPVITGTTYTLSVYAKASERSILQIAVAAGFTQVNRNFDLVSGVIGSGNATGSVMTNAGNGWWRCSITAVATSTTSGAFFAFGMVLLNTSARFQVYAGTEGNGIFLWGAQLEAGAFPTSYIPTTGAALTRSADVCSITGSDFTSFYNLSEGTLFGNVTSLVQSHSSARRIMMATDGTTANRTGILFNIISPQSTFLATSSGSVQALIGVPSITITSPVLIAGSYKANDFAISVNSSAVVTDTSGSVGIGINQLEIGNQFSAEFLNGHIARLQYFRKRLPNAKLITLTT